MSFFTRLVIAHLLALGILFMGFRLGQRERDRVWQQRLERMADKIPDCVEPQIDCTDDPRRAGPHCKDI